MNRELIRRLRVMADNGEGCLSDDQPDCVEILREAALELERSPWQPAKTAPAGHAGIVRQELADGMWRYLFGEWRVVSGVEGWFESDGAQIVAVTHWMPIPDIR